MQVDPEFPKIFINCDSAYNNRTFDLIIQSFLKVTLSTVKATRSNVMITLRILLCKLSITTFVVCKNLHFQV